MNDSIRINKYIAEQGWASRREADELIEAGRILVDGRPAVIGERISANQTVTLVEQPKKRRYLAYYKGRGIITHSPAAGEIDIATKLQQQHNVTGVYPVGRLDKDSEGLILLTNDGRITGPLLDPEAGYEKEYELLLDKPLTNHFIKHMQQGVDIEGYITKPATLTRHPSNDKRCFLTITEGKKHQIRRMCAALGYQVQSLKRIRIMHIQLHALKPNQYRKLTPAERDQLLQQLNIASTST